MAAYHSIVKSMVEHWHRSLKAAIMSHNNREWVYLDFAPERHEATVGGDGGTCKLSERLSDEFLTWSLNYGCITEMAHIEFGSSMLCLSVTKCGRR